MDIFHRKHTAGKYSDSPGDFSPDQDMNQKMKEGQKKLEDTFQGPAVSLVKKLRDKSRETIDELDKE